MQTAITLPVSRFPIRTATEMVVLWLHPDGSAAMPTTLTLKNIPDAVYTQLKAAAALHRRSLNSEAIVCLEAALTPGRMPPAERLERARALRAGLKRGTFDARDIDAMKRRGRA